MVDSNSVLTVISIIANVVAIIVAPIVSVGIAQKLQDRDRKRQDKMNIFKILMESRIYGWTPQSVNALNTIDIVFADESEVIEQWRTYYKALWVNDPDNMQKQTMIDERDNLLVVMAKALGYKDKITLQTIQKPYMPAGMDEWIKKENQYKNNQLLASEMFLSILKNQNGETNNGKDENAVRKPNGKKHR